MIIRLYIVSATPNSLAAQINLRAAMKSLQIADGLEVIDVMKDPDAALSAGILVTPTLQKLLDGTRATMIGRLENREALVSFLSGPPR